MIRCQLATPKLIHAIHRHKNQLFRFHHEVLPDWPLGPCDWCGGHRHAWHHQCCRYLSSRHGSRTRSAYGGPRSRGQSRGDSRGRGCGPGLHLVYLRQPQLVVQQPAAVGHQQRHFWLAGRADVRAHEQFDRWCYVHWPRRQPWAWQHQARMLFPNLGSGQLQCVSGRRLLALCHMHGRGCSADWRSRRSLADW
jgi:hypothetical protein